MLHDWWLGLAGGLMLGVAGILLMALNGRILGVSGLLGGALMFTEGAMWRWSFVAGMLVAGVVFYVVYPAAFQITVTRSTGVCVVAGLLTGIGTQLGGGCTSGHGICGVGRLSRRSIVATMVFMTTGILTVFVVEHVMGGHI